MTATLIPHNIMQLHLVNSVH